MLGPFDGVVAASAPADQPGYLGAAGRGGAQHELRGLGGPAVALLRLGGQLERAASVLALDLGDLVLRVERIVLVGAQELGVPALEQLRGLGGLRWRDGGRPIRAGVPPPGPVLAARVRIGQERPQARLRVQFPQRPPRLRRGSGGDRHAEDVAAVGELADGVRIREQGAGIKGFGSRHGHIVTARSDIASGRGHVAGAGAARMGGSVWPVTARHVSIEQWAGVT